MATLADLRTTALAYLGTASDDPAYPAATLNLLVQQAYDQVMGEITQMNPSYYSTTVTLVPDSATTYTYTFSTQAPPITDYSKWLEVRWTDNTGGLLTECRPEELERMQVGCFAVTGTDDAVVFTLAPASELNQNLFLRYAQWPPRLAVDTDSPVGVPSRYHDLLALRTAELAFALGNEGTFPPNLARIAVDREAALLASVARRGIQPTQTRGLAIGRYPGTVEFF